MQKVTVIAATGATLRGPLKLKLTKDQHARRIAVLGAEWPRGGVFTLDGGQEVQFKYGEEIGIDTPVRLNRALFDLREEDASSQGSAKKKKKSSAKAADKGGAGAPPPTPSGEGGSGTAPPNNTGGAAE